MFFKQRDYIYFPDVSRPVPIEGTISAQVKTQDGLILSGWFLPPSNPAKPVIVFFHGNAGHIGHRLYKVQPLLNAGYGVLLAEYRGYGGNPGEPSEDGLYMDARSYLEWLSENGYAPENLVIYGESLGSGVAVQMAFETPAIKAVILETPYASLPDAASNTYYFIPFLDQLMHDKYDSINKIPALNMPKMLMVAANDEVLGAKTGLDLYEAAAEPKTLKLYEGGYHNTLYTMDAAKDVVNFLETF